MSLALLKNINWNNHPGNNCLSPIYLFIQLFIHTNVHCDILCFIIQSCHHLFCFSICCNFAIRTSIKSSIRIFNDSELEATTYFLHFPQMWKKKSAVQLQREVGRVEIKVKATGKNTQRPDEIQKYWTLHLWNKYTVLSKRGKIHLMYMH